MITNRYSVYAISRFSGIVMGMQKHPCLVQGISMAPWLRWGDVVLVDRSVEIHHLRRGDVVVFRNRTTGNAMVHRVMTLEPLRTKGDRNSDYDPLTNVDWVFEGRAVDRIRDGKRATLGYRRLFWLLSIAGLYPGQVLPIWISRSHLKQWLKTHDVRI